MFQTGNLFPENLLGGLWDVSLAIFLVLVQVAGLVLAARVVLGDRSTQGTIAWVLSLVLLPLLAVPAYALLGRNRFHSYVRARRRIDEQFELHYAPPAEHPQGTVPPGEQAYDKWKILESLTKLPLSRGNALTYHFSGPETFDSIAAGLESARQYILFQFFIFRDDAVGKRFVDILKRKAREGVRVHFLVDAIGCRKLKAAFFRDLEAAGIETAVFLPGRTIRGRLRLNFRNHRKTVIVDGREAWIGGNNIGTEYTGNHPRFGPWRDTHVRVRGPVVNAIQLAFLEDWYWVTRDLPELDWKAARPQAQDARALCLATGPADPADNCILAYVHMINQARERLWIHTPYFVPSEEIIVALQLATLRGVDVRVLLPQGFDKWIVWISSFYFRSLPQLREVRFFRYKKGFFHSKMLLVDNELVSVGTVNFDNRSFRINFEITLILDDNRLVSECRDQMEKDFSEAVEDPDDPLASKGFLFRLAARSLRLLSPLL
ncbi:MAG: cardiolipin synthase [Oceanipulchritudo sp.]